MAEEFRITHRCAGPKLSLTREQLNDKIDRLLEGTQKQPPTVILTPDQEARLKETRNEGLPNLFDIGEVFGLGIDGQAFARQACGNDVTELIEAVPIDGEVHEVKCPKCGTIATVRRVPADEAEAESQVQESDTDEQN